MARWPGTCGRGSPCLRPPRLARLAVRAVAAAVRAVLNQLEPVRVVPPVLAGDVVAVLALLAGQGDLGPHIGGSHEGVPFSRGGPALQARRNFNRTPFQHLPGMRLTRVAEAGLEPATQRL